ncbi:MAG: response regulator [Eubacteriales bacterium]|nr:response regulator [Eubacteriales bacterium]
MKALIVDDEIHMKEAIELMIDWENYGVREVFYAPNGAEALKIIGEERPDILFCDMEMPVMGGEELLRRIVERSIPIQVIAISGYSDFKYVHATLLAKGIDYILKPFSQETLLAAFEKAVSKVRGQKEEEDRLRQYEKMGIAMANQVLQQFCRGETVDRVQMEKAFRKLGADDGKIMPVSILSRNATEIMEKRYEKDRELFFFTIGNVLREVFKSYAFRQEAFGDDFYWMLFLQEEQPDPMRVSEKMKIFEKKIGDAVGIELTWVVCREAVEWEVLEKAVMEQHGLLKKRNVWGCGLTEPGSAENADVPGILSMELLIKSVMRKKDEKALRQLLHDYCRKLKETGQVKLQALQNCTADMNLLLRRMASGQSERDQVRIEPISIWVNDIAVWEKEAYGRLGQIMDRYREEEEPAEKIYSYIQEHYAQDITLSTIAADFYQTPQHIARVFKNRYGMTVVTAIMKVRMKKACELLQTGNLSVTQVAEMVGYEDENYFGRIFKKYMGMTPAQYRRPGKEKGR